MSDNVKDELAKVVGLADAVSWSLADDLAEAALAFLAERGFLVLGPDGEPIDVRPALRDLAKAYEIPKRAEWVAWLAESIPAPLAEACVAAAEVEPGPRMTAAEAWAELGPLNMPGGEP